MAFTIDDDDRGSAASSDNEQDELMEDADDLDAEPDVDADVEIEDDDNEDNDGEDNEDDEAEQDETQDVTDSPQQSQSQAERPSIPNIDGSSDDVLGAGQSTYVNGTGPTSHPDPDRVHSSASPRQESSSLPSPKVYLEVRPEALTAQSYDIVPTMAAPQGTSINALAATPDMRYWFTGGSDCYVRKYDGAATVNGKTVLTVAQKHPFVDTVTKAGVLMSYWENEEPNSKSSNEEPALSPVYSLAVHSEALWLLSGLESGCINLQSVRHDEGKRIASLQKHTSAVSVLTLAQDEKSVLSGSWDKNIFDWDLNLGQVRRSFEGTGGGQISAIEIRPASSLPVPVESEEPVAATNTFSSNNADKPLSNGALINGINGVTSGFVADEGGEDAPGSPADNDSLFGGEGDADSLFGENDNVGAPSGGGFGGDEEDEFSRAMGLGMDQHDHLDSQNDTQMTDARMPSINEVESVAPPPVQPLPESAVPDGVIEQVSTSNAPLINGLPHAEELPETKAVVEMIPETQDAVATSDSTFLAASIDGTLRVWDRRQPNPVAHIPNRPGVPPWCMGACWSPDGNYIYAGRRNGTVEEFSLHKGLKDSERTFKFPAGSGAVSAVRAMPNGRHIVCASHDILRLYDLKESAAFKHSTVPFLIIPGPPRAGVISALHVDPTCRYMLSAAGNRGWEGSNTEVLLGYEIGIFP